MTNEGVIVKQRGSLFIFADCHEVTEACKTFGMSRTTYYKIKSPPPKSQPTCEECRPDHSHMV